MTTAAPAPSRDGGVRARAASRPTRGPYWLVSGLGVLGLVGATLLPPLIAVVLPLLALLVGVVVLGIARGRRSPGTGHAVAALVTASVGLLLVGASYVVPGLGLGLVDFGSGSTEGSTPPAGGSAEPPGSGSSTPQQPEVLIPRAVQASGTAPPSRDAAGNPVTFAATNVVDGDPTTAWRVEGNGIGDYLVLTFDRPVHVASITVVTGYAKVDPTDGSDRFPQNRRVTSADLQFSGGESLRASFADDRRPQSASVGVDTRQVTMRITSTSSAERDFTAVSELEVIGWVLG